MSDGTEMVEERVLWDAAQVGHPVMPFHGGPVCFARDHDDCFGCNRRRGHSGQHVAIGIFSGVVAVWPGEPA